MAECCGSKALDLPPQSTVPPEEEVPPLSSTPSCWDCAGVHSSSFDAIVMDNDNDNCCDNHCAALGLDPTAHGKHDADDDDDNDMNMSSPSLQRRVDDLFDCDWLSPRVKTVVDDKNAAAAPQSPTLLPMEVQRVVDIVAPLSPLSFHASIVDSPSFEDILHAALSKEEGKSSSIEDVDASTNPRHPSSTYPPEAFRVRVVTSSSTVTVELVADDGSWTADPDESVFDEIEDDDGVKTIDIDDVASFDCKHRHSKKSDYYSRLVWLLPASPTGLDGGGSTGTGTLDMLGIEVVPQKHNPNDDDAVSCGGPSTTCSESSDDDDHEASTVLEASRCDNDEALESVPVGPSGAAGGVGERIDPSAPMANTNESISRSATHVIPSQDGDVANSELAEPDLSSSDLLTKAAVNSAGDDGNAMACDTATKPAAADDPTTFLGGEDDVTNPPEPSANPSTTNSEDFGTDPPDLAAEEEPTSVERDQSLLDATEEMEEEKLEDAIVLSFVSAGDAVLLEGPPTTTSVALVEHQPAKTTARRVRSLLNGMFELDDDSNGSAGQLVQVKNVVQRIEEKMVVRRRTVTGNKHFKVSRTKISSDEGSDGSRTTGSGAKAMDPMNLTCRLILRLAPSDTESDASTSEDSSTTVTGSYQLSVAPTDMTQGAESKRMEDVQSFVMMFRQLRAVETRQERWERRFQHIRAGGPAADRTEEAKDNDDEVAARCTRLAERLKEISGRQIVLPDDRDRKRLEAEYRRLEKELEAYGAAFLLSQIHHDEQESLEAKWESDNQEMNRQALQRVRRYMPVKVRTMSVSTLARTLSPNGKVLPENVARKFKVTTTIMQLLRINPNDVERMHPSVLEDLRMVDLTLVERRALHCHLKDVGAAWEKRKNGLFSERRWAWFQMLKSNFKEDLALDSVRKKVEAEEEAVKDDSDDEVSTSAGHTSCTLMNPESDIDYLDDYGFPEGDEYELLTSSPQPQESGTLPDFASTLNELRKTEDDADEVDFFAPLVERMKGLDDEALQFQNEIATLEETIRSLGICHSVHGLEHGKQISSSESSSTTSISS